MNDEQRAELEAQLLTLKRNQLIWTMVIVAAPLGYFGLNALSEFAWFDQYFGSYSQLAFYLLLGGLLVGGILRRNASSQIQSVKLQLDNDAFNKSAQAAQQIQAGVAPVAVPGVSQQYSSSLDEARARLTAAQTPYNISRVVLIGGLSGSGFCFIASIFSGIQCLTSGLSAGGQDGCSTGASLLQWIIPLALIGIGGYIVMGFTKRKVNEAQNDVNLWTLRNAGGQ